MKHKQLYWNRPSPHLWIVLCTMGNDSKLAVVPVSLRTQIMRSHGGVMAGHFSVKDYTAHSIIVGGGRQYTKTH